MTNEELCEHALSELQKKLEGVAVLTKVELQPAPEHLYPPGASWLRVICAPGGPIDCVLEMPADRLRDDDLISAIAHSVRSKIGANKIAANTK